MEFVCWLWCYDKRWMFSKPVQRAEVIWTVPTVVNAVLLMVTLRSLYLDEFIQDQCAISIGGVSFLQVQAALLCISTITISTLTLKIIEIQRSKGEKLDTIENAKTMISTKKLGYWIRHKALHSVSGVGVLCVGLISVLLACIGFGKFYYPRIWDSSSLSSPSSSQQSPSMYQSSSQHFWNLPVPCDQRFEFTLALNIFLPLLSLIPLILTFPTMIAIKATSILGAALFPHFFIKVKKAIGQW